MKNMLITGFDPFGKYTLNPSWQAVQALPDAVGDYALTKLRLLNIYGSEGRKALAKAREINADCILLTGMNSGSTSLTVNAAALNLRDALLEDNLGRKPWNEPVVTGGPAAYFATIDAHGVVRKLRREGLPVELAHSCGGYVCNDVFYSVLRHYDGSDVRVGFVHVPLTPEMVWDEKLARPLEETVAALRRIIEEL